MSHVRSLPVPASPAAQPCLWRSIAAWSECRKEADMRVCGRVDSGVSMSTFVHGHHEYSCPEAVWAIVRASRSSARRWSHVTPSLSPRLRSPAWRSMLPGVIASRQPRPQLESLRSAAYQSVQGRRKMSSNRRGSAASLTSTPSPAATHLRLRRPPSPPPPMRKLLKLDSKARAEC